MSSNPQVRMQTTKGTLILELYPEFAPNTVANFLKLTKIGFYNYLTFHRVVDDFVIQGGCPKGDGTGGPGWTIKCETNNNPLIHERGALSMAHSGKDTGGSQFFIVLSRQNAAHLDGVHTVFGKVIRGENLLEKFKQGDKMIKVSEITKRSPTQSTNKGKKFRQVLQKKMEK